MSQVKLCAYDFEIYGELEETLAPKTVETFKKLLPIKTELVHCRWCGEGIWIPLENQQDMVLENPTAYPSKGEVLFYPGGQIGAEIMMPYGTSVFTSAAGMLIGNHFMTIEGSELLKLRKLGEKVLHDGACDILIEEV